MYLRKIHFFKGMPQKWLKKLERSKSAINTTPVFNISGPTNIKHTLHIGFDPVSGEFMVSLDIFDSFFCF